LASYMFFHIYKYGIEIAKNQIFHPSLLGNYRALKTGQGTVFK